MLAPTRDAIPPRRGGRFGRHRWVVERSRGWVNRFHRLPVRYERRADIHRAFTGLDASRITLNQIGRFCSALQVLERFAPGEFGDLLGLVTRLRHS